MFIVTYQYQGCQGDAVAGLANNEAQAQRIVERIKRFATCPLEFAKYSAMGRRQAPGHRVFAPFDPTKPQPPKVARRRGRGSSLRNYDVFNVLGYTPPLRFARHRVVRSANGVYHRD